MIFQSTITNEQTALLDSAHFDGEIIVIDHETQIEEACRDLATQRIIGFDTETRPSFKAGVTNKVSLLQLSTAERCYLIRLCRVKLHSLILKILSNPNIIKVGADVAGDIRSLHVLRNFNERGFLDLQRIASTWGIEEKSLRKMSAIVLGQRVSKAQRLSNWEAFKLTPQQQMYAATDAWVCIEIYNKLMSTPSLYPIPQEIEEILEAKASTKPKVSARMKATPRKRINKLHKASIEKEIDKIKRSNEKRESRDATPPNANSHNTEKRGRRYNNPRHNNRKTDKREQNITK